MVSLQLSAEKDRISNYIFILLYAYIAGGLIQQTILFLRINKMSPGISFSMKTMTHIHIAHRLIQDIVHQIKKEQMKQNKLKQGIHTQKRSPDYSK